MCRNHTPVPSRAHTQTHTLMTTQLCNLDAYFYKCTHEQLLFNFGSRSIGNYPSLCSRKQLLSRVFSPPLLWAREGYVTGPPYPVEGGEGGGKRCSGSTWVLVACRLALSTMIIVIMVIIIMITFIMIMILIML